MQIDICNTYHVSYVYLIVTIYITNIKVQFVSCILKIMIRNNYHIRYIHLSIEVHITEQERLELILRIECEIVCVCRSSGYLRVVTSFSSKSACSERTSS